MYNDTDKTRGVTLYVHNTQPHIDFFGSKTLYVNGSGSILNGNISLFTESEGETDDIPLYVKGAGLWPGYVTANDTITLFINRPDYSIGINLFCKAIDNPVNSYTSLIINGGYLVNDNITLSVPDVVAAKPDTYIPLSIEGTSLATDSITLAIPDVEALTTDINTYMTLFIQSGIYPNENVDLFIEGINGYSDNITLVVPFVEDSVNQDIQLFVSGW
jgi:hypothetical protein